MNLNNNATDPALDGRNRLVLVVEYEGTNYHGFQWQLGAPTVQGELERALERLTGEKTRIAGASRTDSGVHARGQVVSFRTASDLPPETFVEALNHYLRWDIAVAMASRVPDSFDVRRHARSRRYRYSILNRRPPSPLHRSFTHQVREPLSVEAMNTAAKLLVGTHDFASFSGPPIDRNGGTVREVVDAGVTREGDMVLVDIEANAFLQQQVRRTAGALVEVGLGKRAIEEFQRLLETKTPGGAGPTLPAKGLCLMKINYPDTLFDNEDLQP